MTLTAIAQSDPLDTEVDFVAQPNGKAGSRSEAAFRMECQIVIRWEDRSVNNDDAIVAVFMDCQP